MNERGFSLIETLAVAAVVTIVGSLAVAGWKGAVERGKATQCLANLRVIGVAAALYSAENDGRLPQSTHQGPKEAWRRTLPPYLERDADEVFRSPLAPNPKQSFSYAINDFLTANPYGAPELNYSRRQGLDSASQTVFFTLMTKAYGPTDHFHFAAGGGFSSEAFQSQVQTDVIAGRGHYLFVDGHVEALAWESVEEEIHRPESRFVDPTGRKQTY